MCMKNLLFVSTNKNKLTELNEIFHGSEFKVLGLNDLGIKPLDVDENGTTFSENATLKVLAYKDLTSLPIIADDSGLIVDYLGKDFPGIQSHRYALTFSSQQECNKYVANIALNSPCHFICSISLLYNDKIYNFQGKVDGRITQEKGANGFGYDPIFFVEAKNKTFAELTKEEKDEISHRGQAARSLLKFLEKNY